MDIQKPTFLTVLEAASYLRVGRASLVSLAHSGQIDTTFIGKRRMYFTKEALDAYIARRTIKAVPRQ